MMWTSVNQIWSVSSRECFWFSKYCIEFFHLRSWVGAVSHFFLLSLSVVHFLSTRVLWKNTDLPKPERHVIRLFIIV